MLSNAFQVLGCIALRDPRVLPSEEVEPPSSSTLSEVLSCAPPVSVELASRLYNFDPTHSKVITFILILVDVFVPIETRD